MVDIGARVGAVQKADETTVYFFGFGIYQGTTVPPENVGGFNLGLPNPTIKLDNGENVYGCECWWGPEDKVKEMIGNRELIMVIPKRNNHRFDRTSRST